MKHTRRFVETIWVMSGIFLGSACSEGPDYTYKGSAQYSSNAEASENESQQEGSVSSNTNSSPTIPAKKDESASADSTDNKQDSSGDTESTASTPVGPFTLESPAFANNSPIPALYVAKNGGGNKSIPLAWSGVPVGTGSFAIQMVDNDNKLVHWMIANIPATSANLPAGIAAGSNLKSPEAALGANQVQDYRGPNPPVIHHYELTIYAIKKDVALNLGKDSTANASELASKSLAKASIIGTYE